MTARPEQRFDVAGKRILVTGAGSGLGLAMAEALLEGGATVVLAGRRAARLDHALTRLRELPGRALAQTMDVRDPDSVAAGVQLSWDLLGGLDVLVNNAGIGMRTVNPDFLTDPMPFWRVDPARFRDLVETNLTGYFLVAREVVGRMVSQGRGKVVNISMNQDTMRRRGFVPYGPSRAATDSLSAIMAADGADAGICVNLLLPGGATDTGMIPPGPPARLRASLLAPAVMGPPIRWLCSDKSDGVSGQRLVAVDFQRWLETHRRGGERTDP